MTAVLIGNRYLCAPLYFMKSCFRHIWPVSYIFFLRALGISKSIKPKSLLVSITVVTSFEIVVKRFSRQFKYVLITLKPDLTRANLTVTPISVYVSNAYVWMGKSSTNPIDTLWKYNLGAAGSNRVVSFEIHKSMAFKIATVRFVNGWALHNYTRKYVRLFIFVCTTYVKVVRFAIHAVGVKITIVINYYLRLTYALVRTEAEIVFGLGNRTGQRKTFFLVTFQGFRNHVFGGCGLNTPRNN